MITVGTPLPIPITEDIWIACNGCVLTNPVAAPGRSDVSPVTGVIVRWHLYGGHRGAAFRLRVLTPLGEAGYLGSGSSDGAIPNTNSQVETFSTRLPIEAGQLIGLELEDQGSGLLFGGSSVATSVFLEPAMRDGSRGVPNEEWENGFVFPFNAEVLPPPSVSNLSPTTASFTEPVEVAISGENFAEVQSVNFGGQSVGFTVNSESRITARLPPGAAPASMPVTVVTAAGTAQASVNYASRGCVVPKLKGRRLVAVRRALSRKGCSLGAVTRRHHATLRSGRVKRQRPRPGAVVGLGAKVRVTLGPRSRR
jgi:hypothetical protein